ncbi:hypothetical protein GXP67_17290 [Rhodocytophaga rosea]|uniref:DUF1648 domain-containing protein n=1 Tax=Rhodocytophaga rosea TaxID=2704465 RepID=A0A6C0GJY6_9BACT|nr:hypothetical protein [Rhodocytophaga rosea]QHT68269.1 hypothetical protein GXP67_17290 [Rhodocytophaga rosea]
MKAGYLMLRFMKFLSLAAFLITLFLAYYYLPSKVAIHYTEFDRPDAFIDKPTLFYATGIFVVIFYMAVSLLARLIFSVPAKLFPMPNRTYWLRDQDNQEEFREILRDWLNSLVVIVVLWVILCIYALLRLNTSEDADVSQYTWILTVGAIGLVVWILFLPLRLLVKKNSLLD